MPKKGHLIKFSDNVFKQGIGSWGFFTQYSKIIKCTATGYCRNWKYNRYKVTIALIRLHKQGSPGATFASKNL